MNNYQYNTYSNENNIYGVLVVALVEALVVTLMVAFKVLQI